MKTLHTITENDKDFIHKHKWDNKSLIKKGETADLVIIKCPPNKEIEIKTTHKITFNVKDENGIEIPDITKIGIKKVHPSVGVWIISRITYYNLRTEYLFKQNVMINDRQYIQIWILNPEVDIPKENISFKIEACLTESKENQNMINNKVSNYKELACLMLSEIYNDGTLLTKHHDEFNITELLDDDFAKEVLELVRKHEN